jgi:hypothetical protein
MRMRKIAVAIAPIILLSSAAAVALEVAPAKVKRGCTPTSREFQQCRGGMQRICRENTIPSCDKWTACQSTTRVCGWPPGGYRRR